MNGVHDLGGMHGFGPVIPEPDEPVFHADWERRVLALVLAIGALGRWNIDQNRHTRESLPPATYLGSSYYRIWLLALLDNLAATRLLDDDATTALSWSQIDAGLRSGTPYDRPTERPARFSIGQTVRTRTINPPGHTRLPRYARGKVGRIVLWHGGHVFPDRNAVPVGERGPGTGEQLYTVEFTGTELWGPDADPRLRVSIDAFEPYLEAL
ncbi:nitrile hydratase subunit beta [Granulicoccus sp. GXG6511]|uniref:nitrile hydratase subunit beta n=1 Tax=Granulicoccus sp. GXG6511 TaxID=3381351 RepID=UPI003D7C9559